MEFAKLLTSWYLENRRDLPWRATADPYAIWLSEIILQQTRVAQGLPYYFAFLDAFPTVADLAASDEQRVLRLWQGLGYYSRARNLHSTAKQVAFEMGGIFPDSFDGLRRLKGVGDYTAAAIASFCYGEPVAVVDGNVFRVLSRVFGIDTDISSSPAKSQFYGIAAELMPKDDAALFNQAMMEFGALQCVPKSPDCHRCPMNSWCVAYRLGKVANLPVKSKKAKPKKRYFNYLVFSDEEAKTVIKQRSEKDIWQNLYDFPMIETVSAVDANSFVSSIECENEIIFVHEPENVIHKLTHQHLHISFWKIAVKGSMKGAVSRDELANYPLPAAVFNFVETSGLR